MDGSGDLILLAEDEARIVAVLTALAEDAKAVAAFLLDRSGQLLAGAGPLEELDTTALASLVSGCMAATGSLARLVGEDEFDALVLEGKQAHLYIAAVKPGVILTLLFDHRSTPGLVRFRARRASLEIEKIFADIARRQQDGSAGADELAEISDEDIENLFTD